MLKIGLTGGIGSGKSFIAEIFRKLNIPVYISDLEAKKLMIKNTQIKEQLISLLGNSTYHENGELNRQFVAEKIFGNNEMVAKINSIVHPVVRADFNQWAEKQVADYVLQESAILFEIGANKVLDKMILVTAPLELRIKRVMERDHLSMKEINKRMENQWKQEKKIELADFIIDNSEEKMLLPQVLNVHEKILKFAQK